MAFKRWSITFVLCLSVLLLLSFTKYSQIMAAIAFGESFPEPSETVQQQRVTISTWQPLSVLNGEVVASQQATIVNEFSGKITDIKFSSGQRVNAGDILLKIDASDDYAQLAALNAQQALAQLEVKRFEKLIAQNASSAELLDRANAELDVLRANAKAVEIRIEKKTIRAPFTGQTGIHNLETGQFLAAGTLITNLMSNDKYQYIDFYAPQNLVPNLQAGKNVAVQLPQGGLARAQIIAISPSLDVNTRQLLVRAMLQTTTTQSLTIGSIVPVELAAGKPLDVIELPNTALRYDEFASFVYVLLADNDNKLRAQRQPVEVIYKSQNKVYIKPNIAPGTLVATLGSFKLSEGLLVFTDEQQ